MFKSLSSRLRWPLLGAAGAALGLVTTTALAGSGVGGVFNLGQTNTVDAQTTLNGNPGGSPQLKVITLGTGAAVRGEASNGIGINGVSDSGTGQQGVSQTGIGLLGTHGANTGVSPGMRGETNSTDPNGAGVVGKNNGGGPGLKALVNAGAPPLAVNSQVKVQNLNADQVDDLDSSALQKRVSGTCTAGNAIRVVNADGSVSCEPVSLTGAWSLTGNSGTAPGTDFLGTTDNTALVLKVNGQRALRIEPTGIPSLIGGFSGNAVLAGVEGATIAGGGAAGDNNVVNDNFGTVGGGLGNVAGDPDDGSGSGIYATVGGGWDNTASGGYSTVSGGVTNTAAADYSTVGGGILNTASGIWSTVAGGAANTAAGYTSFAAGIHAQANHNGTFVWGDSEGLGGVTIASTAPDQFIARARGHFFLQSDSTLDDQGGFINTSTGAFLSTGGVWTNGSSRSLKAGFTAVSPAVILRKVAALPVTSWHYKAEPDVRHIGPVSEDFRRSFGVGENSKSIGTVDADGVALAAIQGLYRQNQALKRQNRGLRGHVDTLRAQLNAQNARLTRLERAFAAQSR
jgi:Chaperone of endosialidase